MSGTNSLEVRKPTFAGTIQLPSYQKMIASTIQNPSKRDRFQAAIISAVAVNPALQECDTGSVLAAAFVGESLGLSPSPQLGQYFLVPYAKKATLQIGYKGLIQMAIKSGTFKTIIVSAIKQGELIKYNPITEEIILNPIEDFAVREAAETIGYYAKIELMSGFVKETYWSKEKAEAHGRRFSKAYGKFWAVHFDAMAMKTVLRKLLGTWGVLSNDMVAAFENPDIDKEEYNGELPVIELAEETIEIPQSNETPSNDKDDTDKQGIPDNTESENNDEMNTPSFDDL